MKELAVFMLLAVPAALFAQDAPELDAMPGLDGARQEAADLAEPAQRPDANRLMSEISAALRLSSKQEERISSAVNKKAAEFDKRLKDYEKASTEERGWRYKMNEARHEMLKINRDMPDTVREYLDDEQRQEFDSMLAAKEKPAPRPEPAAAQAKPAGDDGAAKPVKKRRVLRRKKLPAAVRGAAPEQAAPGAADAAAAAPAEEEAGQVMVDKEPGAVQPAPRKRRVLRRKAPAAPAAAAPAAQPPAGDVMTDEPADAKTDSKPAGKAAPAEEDAGSYP